MSALRVSRYWPRIFWAKAADVKPAKTSVAAIRTLRMGALLIDFRPSLAAAAMAVPVRGTAVARLRELAVGTDAGLREPAPEKAIVTSRHRGIGIRPDVLALPMQRGAESGAFRVEAIRFLDHATPPACSSARLT